MSKDDFMAMFISKLKKERKALKLTQADFGMKQGQYSRYESGLRLMDAYQVFTVCEKMQVSADYLLGLPNQFDTMTDDQKAICLAVKNMNNNQIQQLKGALLFLAMDN